MLTERDIERITQQIVRATSPLAVGTFGSYSIGTAHEGSDLDLFVIRETSESRSARAKGLRRLLFGVMYPLDLHVFTPAEFEEIVLEEQSFPWVIARQARIYYWSRAAATEVPSLLARVSSPEAAQATVSAD